MKISLLILLFSCSTFAQTIEDRVEELELQSILNPIKFGGNFKVMYDSISSSDSEYESTGNPFIDGFNSTKRNYKENTVQVPRMAFNLDLSANLTNRTSFHTRFSMSKVFNHVYRGDSSLNPNDGTFRDFGAGEHLQGSDMYVERAYFDFKITEQFIFSAGRLPTIDGLPSNWRDNSPRSGTYPKLAFSNILDGLALTYNVNSLKAQHKDLSIRALYTPLSYYGHNGVEDKPTDGVVTFSDGSQMATFMIDYSDHETSLAESFDFILQYSNMEEFKSTIAGAASNDLKLNYEVLTLYTALNDIKRMGLDLSVSIMQSTASSKGGFSFTGDATNYGWYTNDKSSKSVGLGALVSTRYKLPTKILENSFIGVEYVQGDKNYMFVDFASDNLLNFYTTRGSGTHIYFTKQLDSALSMRVGFMEQNQEYGTRTIDRFGDPTKLKDSKRTAAYMNMRVSF